MARFETRTIDEQIIALPTIGTASGSIATFNTDLAENFVEVKCQIVAKQESGTPSPYRDFPITTYTEINMLATGKNLAPFSNATITSPTTIIDNLFLRKGDYCFSIDVDNQSAIAGSFDIRIGTSSIGSQTFVANYQGRIYKGFRLYEDSVINIILDGANAGYTFVISNAQMEKGVMPTAYEPYNGTTKNIQFGRTIADGVFDIITGKLTITHGYKVFDGNADENWQMYTVAQGNLFRITGQDNAYIRSENTLCNEFQPVTDTVRDNETLSGIVGNFDIIYNSVSSLADWKTFLGYSNLQICYELETPIEIQLDSTQIQAVLNENNVWCDTGDTEVKYLLTVGRAS